MPLTFARSGSRVRIAEIAAGCGFQGRLAAMGIAPGEEIEVLQNSARGAFIVAVKGSRIMLGRGMAQKIQVE
jgi:Fe2+ transport system protein FeoA